MEFTNVLGHYGLDLVPVQERDLDIVFGRIDELLPLMKVQHQQYMRLTKRCAKLVRILQKKQKSMEESTLEAARIELKYELGCIKPCALQWTKYSRIELTMYRFKMNADISRFHRKLDDLATKYQIFSSAQLDYQRYKREMYCQNDLKELGNMLQALVLNAQDLEEVIDRIKYVPELVQTLQEVLIYQQPRMQEHKVVNEFLGILYNKTMVVPPLTDLTGQITELAESITAKNGTSGVYRGLWIGNKVTLRPILQIKSKLTTARLQEELVAWREWDSSCEWNPSRRFIIPFHGTYFIGSNLFAVTTWADTDDLLGYIWRNPDCDRIALLDCIANGLMFLHSSLSKSIVIHGDLRATNVLVSAVGHPVLSGFGLSKIIAEREGIKAAIASLLSVGSSRWMAPEWFRDDVGAALISTASDVWSFGMLCIEALTGEHPYQQCQTDEQVMAQLTAKVLPERPKQLQNSPERELLHDMCDLLVGMCLTWDPLERPNMGIVVEKIGPLRIITRTQTSYTPFAPMPGPSYDMRRQILQKNSPYSIHSNSPHSVLSSSPYSGGMPGSPSLRMIALGSPSVYWTSPSTMPSTSNSPNAHGNPES